MKKSIEFKDFKEARENGLSLEAIYRETKKGSAELRSEVSQQVIDALYDGGIIIKLGRAGKREELDYLKALTSRGNRIRRTDNKEANLIHPGDLIQITINQNTKEKEIRKNGKKIGIAIEGFERSSKKTNKEEKTGNNKKPEPKIIPQETKIPNVEKKPEPKTEIQVSNTPTPNTEKNSDFTPIATNIPTIEKQKSTVEKESSGKLLGYSKNGKNYFLGEKGEPKLIEFDDYTTEYREKLERFDVLLIRIENFKLLYNALISKDPNNKELKNNYRKINEAIENFDVLDSENCTKRINDIIERSLENLKNKEKINLRHESSVLQYIRTELKDYDLVSLHIVEKKFKDVTEIEQVDFENFIQNPSSENDSSKKIEGILGEDYNKIIKKLNDKENEAKNYYVNFREKIRKEKPEISNEELEKYRKQIISTFMYGYGKNLIFNSVLEKKYGNEYSYNGSDEYVKLYSDIHGIGWLDIKDKTLDWGEEVLIAIGTELLAIAAGSLTLGAGAYAVNTMVYGTRGVRFLKGMYETGNIANKTLKGASFLEKGAILGSRGGRFVAKVGIEGVSFYGGYGAVQSLIEGKNMYSKEGLAESIFYIGALKGLAGIYKGLGKEILPNIPLTEQKLKLVSQIGLEGAVLSVPGLYKEGVLFEPGEWNAETIISAFALAAAFKGVGIKLDRVKFKQGKNGEVTAELITNKNETYIHTKTGKKYTKLEDGSFINENGKPVPRNFKPEYLVKEEMKPNNTKAEVKDTESVDTNNTQKESSGTETKSETKTEARETKNTKVSRKNLKRFNDKLRSDLNDLKVGDIIKVDSIEITKQGKNEFTIGQDTKIKKLGEIINEIPESAKINQIKKLTLESLNEINVGESFKFENKNLGKDESGLFIKVENKDGTTDIIRDMGKIKEILENSNIENNLFKNLFYKDVFKKYPELFRNMTDKVGEKLFKALESVDKTIDGVPVLGSLHGFLKWLLYKNSGSKHFWKSLGTPFALTGETINGFRVGGFGEGSKRLSKGIAFGDTTISFKKGVLKIVKYGTIIKGFEQGFKYAKNPEVYTFNIDDKIDEIQKEFENQGLSYAKEEILDIYKWIWFGVIANVADFYLTYQNESKDKDFDYE